VFGHAVIFECVEDTLNAFRVLGEGFDEAPGNFGLVGAGGLSGLSGERLNHVHESHAVHLAIMVGPIFE
jgi:hypothetical protein